MASADVTFGDDGGEKEVDGTQRTWTLTKPGGTLTNTGADSFIADWGAGTIGTVDAASGARANAAGSNARYFSPGDTFEIPPLCKVFTIKGAATTYGTIAKR